MTIEIEKNIPIPPVQRKNGNKYPFDQMEVGDSFFIANTDNRTTRETGRLASALMQNAKKKLGRQFSYRQQGGGVRIWRIA